MSQVRQQLGDTNTDEVEVQDETIKFYLAKFNDNVLQVCYQCAKDLQAKYARYADVTVDDQLTRFKHIYDNYTALVLRFSREIAAAGGSSAGAASGLPDGIAVGGIGDCRGPLDDCCDDFSYGGCYGGRC